MFVSFVFSIFWIAFPYFRRSSRWLTFLITDLNLDNCRSTSIVGLTDEYTALESLSLINVGLTTLKGFPKLPNLKKLELSDNRISNGLNYLTTSPKLQYLNLSGNKIKDLETLKPLEEFKQLAVLDLFNNEATQIDNYREKIFEMLKSLKFLDGFDANDVEAPSEDDDDEVNGNDGEDDGDDDGEEEDTQKAFCLNGIEIDLDELEEFEQRLKAKKQLQGNAAAAKNQKTVDEVDDLDELLKEIKLKDVATSSNCDKLSTASQATDAMVVKPTDAETANAPPLPFALILYWFLAILNLANATFYSCDEEDYASSYVSTSDVSLSEVYNEDLEEDNSEWDEENAAEDEFEDTDDDDSDEDGEGEGGNASAKGKAGKEKSSSNSAAAKAETAEANNTATVDGAAEEDEPQARGKKRKHDG
ncbi:PREDICTED: acidic leucine-rich nuclear phosphoprotein 32 family member A isoform X1 [Bactrocera latifrons]|uniref:acidic leucine-rich nuclear phosphoprotein 32 family member A isoform X1 n=1 Tax=Bactrocera latifrons TaxID=174628 RepID=UPI0008DD1889|nr:PREDICTED: acidic leucine-rich nuclear phosphoprotein 32 family member A isoform X1 [Bactrocera latifrons]